MSLLDVDVNNHDMLLNALIDIFFEVHTLSDIRQRWRSNESRFKFKLDFKYDINRIRKPELYYIYYDYETFKPGTIYDDDGRLTVTFHIFKKYDCEGGLYRILDPYNRLTLKKVYESVR